MNRLNNLSHYEEKTLSSTKCPICKSDLYIISNWMDRTLGGDQLEWCESDETHTFMKPARSDVYEQIDKTGVVTKTFKL